MARLGIAIAIAILSASSAISGERAHEARGGEDLIFFSGGAPALEIKSNASNTACPYDDKKPARTKRSKPVFAVY